MQARARADLVHSQGWESPPLGVAAIGALRLAGARVVVQTSHNTFERGRFLRRTRLGARADAGVADRPHDRPHAGGSSSRIPRARCAGAWS